MEPMDALNIGRICEAVERAEDAAFHAANTISSHGDLDHPIINHLLKRTIGADNRLRRLTRRSEITSIAPGDVSFGERLGTGHPGEGETRSLLDLLRQEAWKP